MNLTDYTSYAEVRASLGVNSTELPDATLALPMYGAMAGFALSDVGADIGVQYAIVKAIPEGSRTSVQATYYAVVQLFALYSLAKHLLGTLPLFSVQRITDGRAEFQRNVDYYTDTRDGVDSALLTLKYRLSAAYAALTGTATPIVPARQDFLVMLTSVLATDPVTNDTDPNN